MVIWNILLTIILALSCYLSLVEHKKNEQEFARLLERYVNLTQVISQAQAYNIEYTDQAILAHEKMAHTGYDRYEPKT